MATDKKFFEVVVDGQYHALHDSSGVPTLKNYRAKFILPTQEAALATICKHLLTPYLRKNYPDFIRFRTHRLVSITLHGYKPNPDVLQMGIEDMNISELYDFCILREILIDPYKHQDAGIDKIRERIAAMYREKRQLQKDHKTAKQGVEIAEAESLRAANQLPQEEGPVRLNVNEQKISQQREANQVAAQARTAVEEVAADEVLPEPVVDANEDLFK